MFMGKLWHTCHMPDSPVNLSESAKFCSESASGFLSSPFFGSCLRMNASPVFYVTSRGKIVDDDPWRSQDCLKLHRLGILISEPTLVICFLTAKNGNMLKSPWLLSIRWLGNSICSFLAPSQSTAAMASGWGTKEPKDLIFFSIKLFKLGGELVNFEPIL